jgi:hypothetical protein
MFRSALPRGVFWVTGGLLATLATAIVEQVTGNWTVALVSGALIASGVGLSTESIREAVTVRLRSSGSLRVPLTQPVDDVHQGRQAGESAENGYELRPVPFKKRDEHRGHDRS